MSAENRFTPKRDKGWWEEGLKTLRLSWRLFRDPLVPFWAKLIPLAAAGYVLLPTDLVPDGLPILGQLDDVAAILLGLRLFVSVCPAVIVQRHRDATSTIAAEYHVEDDREEEAVRPRAASPKGEQEMHAGLAGGVAKDTRPRKQ